MRDMKESGHPWLGTIPEHWDVVYPKMLFSQRKDRAQPGERQLTASQQHGVVFQDEYMEMTGSRVVIVEKDFDILKHVEAGDFVISMRSFQGGIEYSENTGCISSAYVMLIPDKGYVHNRYFKWLLKSSTYINALQSTSNLVRDGQAMRFANFIKVWLPLVPLDEQMAIAEILDHKCTQVDTLIANVQAQIEKLKAYKQSVITEVVTKGLDSSVPMKDSGDAWLGEIPEHWSISRIGRHADVILGKMLCSTQLTPEHTLEPYYCAANIHFDGVDMSVRKEMWFNEAEKQQYLVSTGDLLVVEGGAGAGGCAIIQNAETPMYVQNSIMILRQPSAFDVRYFRYLLESLVNRGYVDLVCNKATIPHFTKDKLSSVPYPILPLPEQCQISDYLDEKCTQIDQLIAIKQKKIDKLNEYKKSLIYEYVTGKKEVS